MAWTLGHVAVSASFDPTARTEGKLDYLTEAERLRAHDRDGLYRGFAIAIAPDAPEVYAELCPALRALGFTQLRGIITGVELTDADCAEASQAALTRCLQIALEQDMDQVFCVAQEWPAGQRDADFEADVLPAFVANVVPVLQATPALREFGIEPLIPAEQQHVNTLAKARRLADACNAELGTRRVYPVPDLAHLYGLVPREQWPAITAELIEAIDGGEVLYGHLSIPETRSDQIVEALAAGELPEEAVRALRRVACVDTEAFDPQDRFLDALRERVPRFAAADPSGWTEDRRFDRFMQAAAFFTQLGASASA
ncbi:MAG: hypothetical protein CMJ94_07310 [Planctomycetes bacterium]|nr:hypothetical protein [Planctomycetota bacterium]